MKQKSLILFSGTFFLLSTDSLAALRYRSGAEVLTVKSQAVQLEYQTFTRSSSYDEEGTILEEAEGDSFSVNDWNFKYSRGLYPNLEGTVHSTFRNVKSSTATSSASNSGIESLGVVGKYLFWNYRKFQNAVSVHIKKALFSNTEYSLSNPPPSDEVALGDDGLGYGIDYLLTYYDKRFRYDFKLGYNKPSADLSTEIPYNLEAIYDMKNLVAFAGFGGIHSLANDTYTATPTLKPMIATGNSRLFNSINREKNYLYLGAQYAFGDFSVGLRGETVVSGKSTDKGNTLAFNVRWEKSAPESRLSSDGATTIIKKDYFADGFVEKLSKSGNLIKINIGSEQKLNKGDNVDIFSIHDYARGEPIASGIIFELSPQSSIIKINKRYNQSPIQTGYLVRVYQ